MPAANHADEHGSNKKTATNGHNNESIRFYSKESSEILDAAVAKRAMQATSASANTEIDILSDKLYALYSPAIQAKVWSVASKGLMLTEPPILFPEYTRTNGKDYIYREPDFWTSGFFPGILYQLLKRSRTFPSAPGSEGTKTPHPMKLEFACKWWTERLHSNAAMTTTHDLGFMIAPWARPAWELNHDARAFETLKLAARSLLSRFSGTVGLIRSWDVCVTKRYQFQEPDKEFLVVIDNMMNLDLLFYVACHTNDRVMWDAAVQHAKTTQTTHIRADSSSTHLIVFDPNTGAIQQRLTNQGYDDESCWTRGQAWAIAGFAETYGWTHDASFLKTAQCCADLFIMRLSSTSIPPWDFDAALRSDEEQPPDTSAAVIASYGMLLIYKAYLGLGDSVRGQKYLTAALKITAAICASHTDTATHMSQFTNAVETVEQGISQLNFEYVCNTGGDTVLTGATINNYEHAPRRWTNHGLVYADYFFVLVGNLLLELGIGASILQATKGSI